MVRIGEAVVEGGGGGGGEEVERGVERLVSWHKGSAGLSCGEDEKRFKKFSGREVSKVGGCEEREGGEREPIVVVGVIKVESVCKEGGVVLGGWTEEDCEGVGETADGAEFE